MNTIFYDVLCNCGHQGKIKFRENDTPYSGGDWQSYSLQDLDGQSYHATNSDDWQTIFKHLKPVCRKCNTPLHLSNVIK